MAKAIGVAEGETVTLQACRWRIASDPTEWWWDRTFVHRCAFTVLLLIWASAIDPPMIPFTLALAAATWWVWRLQCEQRLLPEQVELSVDGLWVQRRGRQPRCVPWPCLVSVTRADNGEVEMVYTLPESRVERTLFLPEGEGASRLLRAYGVVSGWRAQGRDVYDPYGPVPATALSVTHEGGLADGHARALSPADPPDQLTESDDA